MCHVMFSLFCSKHGVYYMCVCTDAVLISYLQIVQEMFLLFCHGYDCN